MATPTATQPVAYGTRQTIQTGDYQNAPPCFIELAGGKLLFVYAPSTNHTAQDASLVMKTATSEAAANAGTFSSATTIVARTPDATGTVLDQGYQPGGLCQVQEGPYAGRVWLTYTKFTTAFVYPRTWTTGLRYSDDDGETWSAEVTVTSVFSGVAVSPGEALSGMSTVTKMVEIPGTDGEEFVMPVLGFTGGMPYESVKFIASTDSGFTWSERSVVHGPEASAAPSEPTCDVIYTADGTPRLLVGVNYWPSTLYVKWSDDWGMSWKRTVSGSVEGTPGAGTNIATGITAPPYFIQCGDGSLMVFYRNLGDSERTWTRRSVDYGATWGQATQLDSAARRSRYGQWGNLNSGRLGLCYSDESMTFPSADAAIYWRTFTVTPPTGGVAPSITSSAVVANSPTAATFTATVDPNAVLTKCYAEYSTSSTYWSSDWVTVGRGDTGVAVEIPVTGVTPGTTYNVRLVASNLSGETNGSYVTLNTRGMTIVGSSGWSQNGSALTVIAPSGAREVTQASVYTALGGRMQFAGANASRFEVSADGVTWGRTLLLSPGVSTVFIGVTPQTGDGALVASVGVPL